MGSLDARLPSPDDAVRWIPRAALALAGLGWVLIHAAAAAPALSGADGSPLFARQIAFALAGLLAMGIAASLPLPALRVAAPGLALASLAVLAAVLVPGVGAHVNGARRWFRLGSLSIQPSEFAKPALILALAACVERTAGRRAAGRTVPPVALVLAFAGLVILEPDVGGALLLGMIGAGTLWVAGRIGACGLLGVLALGAPAVALLRGFEHVRTRLQVFLHPQDDPLGRGYQIAQSIGAISSGGLFGRGLGEGTQRLGFLPEHSTDFLFATLGEELGLAGEAGAILLVLALVGMCLAVSARARTPFGSIVAAGVGITIGTAAALNVGVACGALPPKGLAFPLLSYGGSALVATFFGLGLVLAVARDAAQQPPDSGARGGLPEGRVR